MRYTSRWDEMIRLSNEQIFDLIDSDPKNNNAMGHNNNINIITRKSIFF